MILSKSMIYYNNSEYHFVIFTPVPVLLYTKFLSLAICAVHPTAEHVNNDDCGSMVYDIWYLRSADFC